MTFRSLHAVDLAKHQQTLSPFWSVVARVGFLAVFGLLAWLSVWHVDREVKRREVRPGPTGWLTAQGSDQADDVTRRSRAAAKTASPIGTGRKPWAALHT